MGDRPVGHRRRRRDPLGPPAVAAPTGGQLASTSITTTTSTTTTTSAMARPTSNPASAAPSAAPTARRKAPKPNRQRCKEFRERRKSHVVELEERVVALRREVSELVMQKSIYASKVMLKRHHAHGSLEKLVREYFTLFRYGIAIERPLASGAEAPPPRTSAVQKAKTQLEFLHRVIDPDTVYGDHKGPAGCVAQWGYYTAAYASFVGEVNRVSISGTEDDPILYCFTTYHVILSRNTVKYLFPHAIHNEPLVQRMIGLYVPCPVVGIYQFTADGHISAETANIELADALLSAGCRVEDVAEIMQGFVVSDLGQVPDRLQAEDYHFMEEIGVDFDSDPREEDEEEEKEKEKEDDDDDAAAAEADDDDDAAAAEAADAEAQAKEKLRISFLVGEDDGDLEEKANPPAQGS